MPLGELDIFQNIITRHDIEVAVIDFLKKWIVTYLAEIERQTGLAPQTIPVPPDPDNSFRGTIDFENFTAAWSPCLLVQVRPYRAPERLGNTAYNQIFHIRVGSFIQEQDEDTAREYADYYGGAVMAALMQHGGLGYFNGGIIPVGTKTVLSEYPSVTFHKPDVLQRRVCCSIVGVHTIISDVVVEQGGPDTPPSNPYLPALPEPTAQEVDVEFHYYPLNQELPHQTPPEIPPEN